MQDIHTFTLHCHAVIFFMLATAAELTLLGSWKHLKLSYLLYWGSTQLLTERRKGEHLLQPLCSEQGQAPNVLQDGESLVPLGSQRHQILPSLASWWNFPCSPTGERQLVLAVGRGVLNYDMMKDKLVCREMTWTFLSVLMVQLVAQQPHSSKTR